MYELIYARIVERDLQSIYDYIALDSVERAKKYLNEIKQSIKKLESFPTMGTYSRYPELKDIRILPHDRYLIFYKFDNVKITIIRILHGSRNYKNIF